MNRPIHTMTPDELRSWTGQTYNDEYASTVIQTITTSLNAFFKFLANYGSFDSITWLVENGFDISFQHARLNGNNKL